MKHGFSLVELSIVLVILGLLTGGILAGQNLIRAAELRAVSTQLQNFQSAVNTFRDKYFALPGDMRNATDFWGTATCPGNQSTPSTDSKTCNGDGNGAVQPLSNVSGGISNEIFRFWQQLANAGLIEGSYTGVQASASSDQHSVLGLNVPTGKISNTGWAISYWNTTTGDSANFANQYGNNFIFGAQNGNLSSGHVPGNAALRPEEAWNIDTKLDDGRPGYGKVIAIRWDDCTDATSATDLDSEYLLSDTSIQCAFRIKN